MSKRSKRIRSHRSLGSERLESRYAMDASFTAAKFNFGTASSPLENGITQVFTREYEYHFIEYEYEKCKAHRPSTVWRRWLQT